jgi:hypothetical protein
VYEARGLSVSDGLGAVWGDGEDEGGAFSHVVDGLEVQAMPAEELCEVGHVRGVDEYLLEVGRSDRALLSRVGGQSK